MQKEKWRWIFLSVVVFLSLILLLSVKNILSPFIVAFILAYLLNPLVESLERYRLGRKISIAIVFIGIISIVAITLFLILPKMYLELLKLSSVLPKTMQTLDEFILGIRSNFETTGLPSQVFEIVDQHVAEAEVKLMNRLDQVLDRLPEIITSTSLMILSPILAIYILADWKRIQLRLLRVVPQRFRLNWQRVIQDISHIVRCFLRGNVIVAVIVGVLTGVGVKLIGMDYALVIGIVCGIFDLIPYFGPVIAAVPSVLLGLVESPYMALKVVLVLLVVQQLEEHVIAPKLMGNSVGLHPLWIVFALLAGGELGGIWGMLFSVPIAAIVRLILRHIYFWLVSPDIERKS